MARSDRYNQNLQKVQDMLDGNNQGKIQSGYDGEVQKKREIGDVWTDSDGVQWEQKNGYKSKLTKVNVGIFSKRCKTCNKPCTKKYDKDTWNRMKRCYHCQMNFELDLKFMKIGKDNNKWFFWVKLQELKRWESIDNDMEQLIFDNHEMNKKNPYDKSVVNAMANANVSMQIKKNS